MKERQNLEASFVKHCAAVRKLRAFESKNEALMAVFRKLEKEVEGSREALKTFAVMNVVEGKTVTLIEGNIGVVTVTGPQQDQLSFKEASKLWPDNALDLCVEVSHTKARDCVKLGLLTEDLYVAASLKPKALPPRVKVTVR